MKLRLLVLASLLVSLLQATPFCQTSDKTGPQKPSVMAIALDSQGANVAVFLSGSDSKLQLWNVLTGKMVREFNNPPIVMLTMTLSHDGKLLAGVTFPQGIVLWDVATGRTVSVMENKDLSPVSVLRFSPDGKLIAGGEQDGTVVLWDLASQHELRRMKGHDKNISALAFSPNNKLLASGSWDNVVHVWDMSSSKPQPQLTLTGHVGWINSVAFGKDSQRLVSGGNDGIINLWSVTTGKNLVSIPNTNSLGMADSVASVIFTPDDVSVLGLGLSSCMMWNATTGKNSRRFDDLPVGSTYLAIGKDNKLVTVGLIGTVASQDFVTGQHKTTFSVLPNP